MSEAVRGQYDRLAPNYDRRWRRYIERTVGATVRRVRARPGDRVLDLAAGTGALTRALLRAEPALRVVALDLSRAMLRRGADGGARWVGAVQGDAGALPFANASFDHVVSSSAFHYWPDPARALREIHRVLRPGGACVITDWCDDYLACRVCARVLSRLEPSSGRILRVAECGAHLEAAGFRVESLERFRVNWLWGMLTARAVVVTA
ncbi:MAG: methyltransferase domain-containing protein [bacterium]